MSHTAEAGWFPMVSSVGNFSSFYHQRNQWAAKHSGPTADFTMLCPICIHVHKHQLFSSLSTLSLPPPSELGIHTGFCGCMGARCQPRPQWWVPTIMYTLGTSPSNSIAVHHQFDLHHQPLLWYTYSWQDLTSTRCIPTFQALTAACVPRFSPISSYWPTAPVSPAASTPRCAYSCLWLNSQHWPPLACACGKTLQPWYCTPTSKAPQLFIGLPQGQYPITAFTYWFTYSWAVYICTCNSPAQLLS